MTANRCRNPICEYFNRTLPNNAKVCVYCGKDLGNVVKPPDPPPGPPIETEDEKTIVEKRSGDEKPIIIKPIYPIDPILPLLKLIHYSGREFQWSGEAGVIGRRSKKMNISLAIDLTGIPDQGIISRPHAQVTWDRTQKKYMILDLKSTNGTSLNGTSLNPGVQYPLMNSDLLQFGQDNLVRFMVCVI
jgi:FHA domain